MGSERMMSLVRFQFMHPRGVRPGAAFRDVVPSPVSIHAPARGATERGGYEKLKKEVSIHAPARGATA